MAEAKERVYERVEPAESDLKEKEALFTITRADGTTLYVPAKSTNQALLRAGRFLGDAGCRTHKRKRKQSIAAIANRIKQFSPEEQHEIRAMLAS